MLIDTHLHLIKPLGFSLDESYIKDPAFKDFMYDNEDNNNDNI